MPWLALLPLLATPLADLPFETCGGRIYIEAEISGKRTPMVLDSGAGVTLLEAGLAKEVKVESSGQMPVGGAGTKPVMGDLLKNASIKIGNGAVTATPFLSLPLTDLWPFEGREIPAIIGSDVFQRYTVQIDYANRRVRFYTPGTYTPPATAKSSALRIVGRLPVIDVPVSLPGLSGKSAVAMLDTGASGAYLLTKRFGTANKLDTLLPPAPSAPLSGGVGGQSMSRYLRLSALTFGGIEFPSVPGTLTTSDGGVTGGATSYDMIVGAEILRRFTVTFDYTGSKVWFDPNKDLSAPFPIDHTGLLLKTFDGDYRRFKVYGVVPKSPAAEIGVAADDEVLSVDGKDAKSFTMDDLRATFRRPGSPIRLKLLSKGQVREVTIVRRAMA